MGVAVERLRRARSSGEKVAIVGDYDADGVAATALLAATLRSVGIETLTILPSEKKKGTDSSRSTRGGPRRTGVAWF